MIIDSKLTKVIIEENLLGKCGNEIKKLEPFKVGIVTDPSVAKFCLKPVKESLENVDIDPIIIKVEEGERHKNIETVEKVWKTLIKNEFTRKSLLIALGGGVIGDLTGFIASTFMRGIDFVQIPTTLLAQVDASIGGKTGIDFMGKNVIGTFHQPKLVLIDPQTLTTLPKDELINGMAEVVKHGIIQDEKLFEFIEENLEDIMNLKTKKIEKIIARSVEIKLKIVEEDERESGLRMVLNLGHSVGHAIERTSEYKIKHGSAVSIGMVIACRIAERMLDFSETSRVERLLSRLDLPITHNLDVNKILKAIRIDKKAWFGRIVFILPERIGKVRIMDVPENIILDSLREGMVIEK